MEKKICYAAIFKDGTHKVYSNWPDCQRATSGVSEVVFKGFVTRDQMHAWLAETLPNGSETSELDTSGSAAGPQILPPNTVLIYVDGSYVHSRCKRAGWAWVAVQNGQVIAQDSGVTAKDALSRNIDGELEAAIKAMEWAKANQHKAVIHHDYTGISNWASGAWKVKSVIAQEYQARIKDLKSGISFKKVVGHSGDLYNDMVDKLAGEAIVAFVEKNRS